MCPDVHSINNVARPTVTLYDGIATYVGLEHGACAADKDNCNDKEEENSVGHPTDDTPGVNKPIEKRDRPRHGIVANTLNSFRNGAVGFIDWLGLLCVIFPECGGSELYRICGGV